jgi:Uma2 family endonuclease
MIAVPNSISPEEYLEIERQTPIHHEYRRGLVYAMAGGTDNHDRIAQNLLYLINLDLRNSPDYSGSRTDELLFKAPLPPFQREVGGMERGLG